ncbi:hypothetical protein AW67_37090 [Salmonella enterica subsp. enterica serovar Montevideo str. USDA-ARS-USMARC-1903]|nr:hypothetical protein AW67_37090 [Salmonella enterica subsp. enterica serovar Montevideo str. USDA-ARS-USMARC-1903]
MPSVKADAAKGVTNAAVNTTLLNKEVIHLDDILIPSRDLFKHLRWMNQ